MRGWHCSALCGLTPRVARGQPAAVQIRSRRIIDCVGPCRTEDRRSRWPEGRQALSNSGFVHITLCAQIRKTPLPGRFAYLAERVGFEPTVGLHQRLISSQVHSTTLPPLRGSRGSTREPAIIRWRGNTDNCAAVTLTRPSGMLAASALLCRHDCIWTWNPPRAAPYAQ